MIPNNVKVLHVVHWPKSGISKLVSNLVCHLDVKFINSIIVFIIEDAVEVEDIRRMSPNSIVISTDGAVFKSISKLWHIIKKENPDILHSHTLIPIILCTLLKRNIKHVTTVHGEYPFLSKTNGLLGLKAVIFKFLVRNFCDKVICVSEKIGHKIEAIGLDKRKVLVINNAIPIRDVSELCHSKKSVRESIGIKDSDFVFISVGRLSYEKGYVDLINEFYKAFQLNMDVYLVIIGDGNEKGKLLKIIDEFSNYSNVKMLGHIYDPYKYLCSSDVYICNSVYEGFGLAIVEAMNCKLPFVSTDVGVVQNIVNENMSNIVVNNTTQMSQSLLYCYQNRKNMRNIGELNYAIVIDEFCIEKMANRYQALYVDLLQH